MGRVYTATFTSVTVSAAQDLFEIVAPADAIVEIHEFCISQSSDVGDAAEEGLAVEWKSGATVSGSGGSSVTPAPLEFGDAAFGGTCEANNTTKANTGTIVTHLSMNWNIRIPLQQIFTPESRPILSPSRRGTLELVNAPADALTVSGYVVFREVGG